MGTREISGSPATRFKKRRILACESSIASSILISIICAPFSTCWRATASASSNFSSRIRRKKALEPVTLVRSPTLTNKESSSIFKASRPERRVLIGTSGTSRAATPCIAAKMAAICAGVVPQQPPTIFTKPDCANSRNSDEVSAGVSSKPVSLMGLGKPAFG